MEKNDAQISRFAVVKKTPSPWKTTFFEKKSSQLIFADKIFKTACDFLKKINGSRDISVLVILRFRKIVLHHKIINKILMTKKQENSAGRFGENYLINHLVKFLQDKIKPWRVGALRACTNYHFFTENRY